MYKFATFYLTILFFFLYLAILYVSHNLEFIKKVLVFPKLWDKELQLPFFILHVISKPVWLLNFCIIWKKVMKIYFWFCFFCLAIQLKSEVYCCFGPHWLGLIVRTKKTVLQNIFLLLSWVNEDRIFIFVWTTPIRIITNQAQY